MTIREDEMVLIEELRELKKGWVTSRSFSKFIDQVVDRLEALSSEREILREALTPSAETKAAYIGEFSFTIAEGEYGSRIIPVPWTTIKKIMAAIRERAALDTGVTEG